MKNIIKSTALLFLIFGVSASLAFAQTKKKTTRTKRRGAKITTVKKTITTKKKIMKDEKSAGAMTTASGLIYQITEHGTGAQVKAGDTVIANYTGLLTSGLKLDSSLDTGETFEFPVGAVRVIKGWDEGFQKLRVGDKAIFTIPSALGYGERGAGGAIPPNATLIFIVEVVGVK